MPEIIALLTIYYHCGALAAEGLLTQTERFACNETYQQAKRLFLEDEVLRRPGSVLTPEQNTRAFLRFKTWEQANAALVAELKSRHNTRP